ncbi:alpha/beta fold hydrolase [Streptomyces sp. NBC_01728]|uniref:alpha/beta hydrolase n=1 Tax=unclassified Streptomyces TaxID=2593676 RepID=UPI002250665A|nr:MULTISPECIES: alpha/beta fold hydrolase [unclassified Streptomyces]MCX4459086.1 alpha/beta fold hydrolase [Streptomyces sp. NBC_01719]MCX4498443.1 alpha/beta fold hydrolase [Streptomyces sp. NBC_01728]
MILRTTDSRTRPTLRRVRSTTALRPLHHRLDPARVEEIPFRADDGVRLGLTRVDSGDTDRPAVLLLHGHTASADMFLLPETRNLVDVLLDDGYEPWLLDWRGSCRLPYNETGQKYTYDDVALYDIPAAVAHVRGRIGDRPLFVVAHCVGSLTLSLSMTAGLVPGLAGVVSQGVFLTPKLAGRTSLRMSLAGELLRSRLDHIPVDIRKAGLWSKYTPLFALASRGASCPDPTCQILHNSAWGTGASLFVHEHLSEATHHRLAELLGPAPLWILPHLRRIELARTVVRWHDGDHRYRALPQNALDAAARIDTPVLLLAGSENGLWLDSQKLCHDVLARRQPQLDVTYTEIPGYGHLDTFLGRGAALDVFGHILEFLGERR